MGSGKNAPGARVILKKRAQRWREVLALYAASPLAENIRDFCQRNKIPLATWNNWCSEQPEFRGRLREIQDQRATYVIEPIRVAAEALGHRILEDALAGDSTAQALAAKMLGLVPSGNGTTVNVQQQVGVSQRAAIGSIEDMEELLRERSTLVDTVLRIRERARTVEADSGDPGPGANGGGALPEP